MALIIEDGTGLANAQAYVSAADTRTYASLRGISLPAIVNGVDPIEAMLVLATDYLESLRYILNQATTTQALQWPRVQTCWNEFLGAPDPSTYFMPTLLVKAQSQLVIEQAVNGIDLMPSTVGGTQFITREKVDVIETSYSEKLGTLSTPTMPRVAALLQTLIVPGGVYLRNERA